MNLSGAAICSGFEDNVFGSQRTFRLVMDAMSFPGKKRNLTLSSEEIDHPKTMLRPTAALILTLFDPESSFSMNRIDEEVNDWIGFHCGSAIAAEKKGSDFHILKKNESLNLNDLSWGTFMRPDLSATIIAETQKIEESSKDDGLKLTGPGIKEFKHIKISGMDTNIFKARGEYLFPLGFDFLLTDETGFLCIPRTTKIEGL